MAKKFRCPLQKAAELKPKQPAVFVGKDFLNYEQLDQLVRSLQKYLRSNNQKYKNTTCAVITQNTLIDIVLLWALWRERSTTAILNPKLPAQSLKDQIKFLRCRRIFAPQNLKKILRLPQISFTSYEELAQLDNRREKAPRKFIFNQKQKLTILYTSGSSTTPKPAVHSFGNHYFNALGSNKNIPLDRTSRWLLSLPIYHVSGLSLLFRSVLAQSALVLYDKSKNLTENFLHSSFTNISLVPTQLQKLLDKKAAVPKLKSLKAILLGGSAIASNLLDKARTLKLPVYLTYGLTEMASQVATTTSSMTDSGNPICWPLAHRKIKISKDDEILVKGPSLFLGYQTASGKIHLPLGPGGWFPTKDRGLLDKKNGLKVLGRLDNMFISSGENIQPEEIEKYLYQLKGIQRAVVVAAKNELYGFRPIAFIKTENKRLLNKKNIQKYLSQYLPKFKIPVDVLAWPKDLDWRQTKINRSLFI